MYYARCQRERDAEAEERRDAEAHRVIETYGDDILRLAYAYLRSRADAEDVCQDVLLKLMTHAGRFRSPEHERAWVIRCTANACKDVLKSAARRTSEPLEAAGEPTDPTAWVDGAPAGWMPDLPTGADVLTGAEVRTDADGPIAGAPGPVTAAVLALPLAYREAIHLYYYEGLSIKRAAEVAGTSESAMTKRLSRARAMLRDKLRGESDGEND